jgi:WD40 repeat protein
MGGWPGPGVRIRRFGTHELIGFCLRDSLPAVGSSFSADNRLWATAYDDGVFAVWNVHDSRKPLLEKTGFDKCTGFALSHDLKQLAYADDDGTIRMLPLDLP